MSQNLYTLQPVPYDFPPEEQKKAQFSLWKASNTYSPKLIAILSILAVASLAGIIFISGYSTIIFWLILFGVAAFIALKEFGLAWYVKQQIESQPTQQVSGLKMGVQPQGIVLIQKMGAQEGRALVEWKDIKQWRETPEYLFLFFSMKGQNGTHVIPTSYYTEKKFPIGTVRKHLLETVGPATKGAMVQTPF